MRLFFLSSPLPDNICLVYKAKTLLFMNSTGGISCRSIDPIVTIHIQTNVLRAVVLANAPTSVIKQFLSLLKIQLIKQLVVLCGLEVFT